MARFFILCFFLFGSIWKVSSAEISAADSAVFRSFWEYAKEKELVKLSVASRVPIIGEFFLNTPYTGGTLNKTLQELPTINLRELDCVIFVEVTLALAMLEKYEDASIPQFVENILKLRYRNGEIVDYTSRLHYSSDWLYEMDKAGIVKDVTPVAYKYPIDVFYMTEHASRYVPLSASPLLKQKMKSIETAINKRTYHYIPDDKIKRFTYRIKSGDVILITTNIKGLDTCHVGFAIRIDGKVYLLHASEKYKKVVVSENTLEEYIEGNKHQTGIMLGRINPVEEIFMEY